jgi:hypothetical protein
MKVQREVEIITLPMINLGSPRECFVSETVRLLYLQIRNILPTAEEAGWVPRPLYAATGKNPLSYASRSLMEN